MDSFNETKIIKVGLDTELSDRNTFANDVQEGLRQEPKTLSSKYFYDRKGSELFRKIMELPEYYLTRCELEILHHQKKEIEQSLRQQAFFHLVDLGAGDALKTKILLRQLVAEKARFEYLPVDISEDALRQLSDSLRAELPELSLQAVAGDYLRALNWLEQNKPGPKVLLFLGSNIGNFRYDQSVAFLQNIRQRLQPGDKLLIGFDLRKDPILIRQAYDDTAGVTAAFNLNLLDRINHELGGDFDLSAFRHFAEYDPFLGVIRSFLLSTIDQQVHIQATGDTFQFQAWEAIHTENSHKYSYDQIRQLAEVSGFEIEVFFTDRKKYFADILFKVA